MTILSVEECLLQDHVSIEGLRNIYSSCFTCGVSWNEDHVSLDCRECGGYALVRPCPHCKGSCGNKWTRNLKATHTNQKASWEGSCALPDSKMTRTSREASKYSFQRNVSSVNENTSSSSSLQKRTSNVRSNSMITSTALSVS